MHTQASYAQEVHGVVVSSAAPSSPGVSPAVTMAAQESARRAALLSAREAARSADAAEGKKLDSKEATEAEATIGPPPDAA